MAGIPFPAQAGTFFIRNTPRTTRD